MGGVVGGIRGTLINGEGPVDRVHNGIQTPHGQEVESGAADKVEEVLNKTGVDVKRGRRIDKALSLIDRLCRESNIPIDQPNPLSSPNQRITCPQSTDRTKPETTPTRHAHPTRPYKTKRGSRTTAITSHEPTPV